MSVSPRAALLDVPIAMEIRGLSTGSKVLVSVSAADAGSTVWTAAASYDVPANGVLTLSQPAVSGSYTGVDPMGLLLSMVPPSCHELSLGACGLGSESDPVFIAPKTGYAVRFTAKVHGRIVATAKTLRENPLYQSVVRDTPLRPRSDGLYGDLLTPRTILGRRPGVVVFGGSEGGESGGRYAGSLLAAHGYPVLALAYFGEPGLPQQLRNVPLEYFAKAIAVLRAQPDVDPRHVLVYGSSRGGELALLLGATYPSKVNGVVAGVPSSNVNGPYPSKDGAAWTLHGRPVAEGPIAVEQIRGPILLSCAGMDAVWPSCTYTAQITARLAAHQFAFPVQTLHLADGGHFAGDLTCCASETNASGGTTNANALAQIDGQRALLKFLADQ